MLVNGPPALLIAVIAAVAEAVVHDVHRRDPGVLYGGERVEQPRRITVDPDGNVRFIGGRVDNGQLNRIGRITPSGQVTMFSPGPRAPDAITYGTPQVRGSEATIVASEIYLGSSDNPITVTVELRSLKLTDVSC